MTKSSTYTLRNLPEDTADRLRSDLAMAVSVAVLAPEVRESGKLDGLEPGRYGAIKESRANMEVLREAFGGRVLPTGTPSRRVALAAKGGSVVTLARCWKWKEPGRRVRSVGRRLYPSWGELELMTEISPTAELVSVQVALRPGPRQKLIDLLSTPEEALAYVRDLDLRASLEVTLRANGPLVPEGRSQEITPRDFEHMAALLAEVNTRLLSMEQAMACLIAQFDSASEPEVD